MIQVTHNFLEAIRAGEQPIVLAYVGSSMGTRVFGKVHPLQQWTGSSGGVLRYDGSVSIGDGSLFGSEGIILDADDVVISFGSLRETLVPEGNDLLASLRESEKTGAVLVLNNEYGTLSDLLANERFITRELVYTVGFPSLSYADFIQVFSGEIVREHLSGVCTISSTSGTRQDLEEVYYPGRSSRYANPESQDEILPDVFGNCAENATGGPIKAVCIDTNNHYYLFANHAVQRVADGNVITVYEDGAVLSSGFAVETAFADENGDVVSLVNFTSAPSGIITVSCHGMADGSGNLYENPIDILDVMLDRMGVSDVRNAQAFAKARQTADSEGYKAAGVIVQEQVKSFWVKQLLNSFLGDFWHNARDELVVSLDTISRSSLEISAFLDDDDLDYSSADGPERLRENICNQAIVRYAPFFTRVDRRFSEGSAESWGAIDDGESTKDLLSQGEYGIQQRPFDLWWVREDATALVISGNIVSQFKDNIYTFPLVENGFKHCYLERGDYIVCGCRYLRDEDGGELKNQIWRVLDLNKNYDRFRIEYLLVDTGDYYPEPPVYYDGAMSVGSYSGRGRSALRLVD